jgi:hypothetical protein
VDQNQAAIVVIQEVSISEKLTDPDKHPEDRDVCKNDWKHISCCEEQENPEIELVLIASNYECDK